MLHKTSYVQGFHLVATDGEIGHVTAGAADALERMRAQGLTRYIGMTTSAKNQYAELERVLREG